MSFGGEYAWEVVVQTKGLWEIWHNAGCGELSCFLDMQIHSLWFGWESWVSVSSWWDCLFVYLHGIFNIINSDYNYNNRWHGYFTNSVPSAVISYCTQEPMCPSTASYPLAMSAFWLFQVSPPQEQQPFPSIKKKIIKECCEHFWGCPVQKQELDSVVIVGHFQLRIFCFSDSNMI